MESDVNLLVQRQQANVPTCKIPNSIKCLPSIELLISSDDSQKDKVVDNQTQQTQQNISPLKKDSNTYRNMMKRDVNLLVQRQQANAPTYNIPKSNEQLPSIERPILTTNVEAITDVHSQLQRALLTTSPHDEKKFNKQRTLESTVNPLVLQQANAVSNVLPRHDKHPAASVDVHSQHSSQSLAVANKTLVSDRTTQKIDVNPNALPHLSGRFSTDSETTSEVTTNLCTRIVVPASDIISVSRHLTPLITSKDPRDTGIPQGTPANFKRNLREADCRFAINQRERHPVTRLSTVVESLEDDMELSPNIESVLPFSPSWKPRPGKPSLSSMGLRRNRLGNRRSDWMSGKQGIETPKGQRTEAYDRPFDLPPPEPPPFSINFRNPISCC